MDITSIKNPIIRSALKQREERAISEVNEPQNSELDEGSIMKLHSDCHYGDYREYDNSYNVYGDCTYSDYSDTMY